MSRDISELTKQLKWVLIWLGATVVALCLWEILVAGEPKRQFLFGSPSGVYRELYNLAVSGALARHFGVTLFEAAAGLLLGMWVGSCAGLLLWRFDVLERFFRPYLLAAAAIPMVALGPLLVFWLGTGVLSKVLIAALCTAPVALAQARTGASTASRGLVEMARCFSVPESRIFLRLVVPSAFVWILASLRLNVSLALLGAFTGEFLASRAGLGHLIIVAEGLYDLNQMWAGIVGIMVIALMLHAFALPLELRFRRYTYSTENN